MGNCVRDRNQDQSQDNNNKKESTIWFQENEQSYYFDIKVEDLLSIPIQKLTPKKKYIYDQLISTLTDKEKRDTTVRYLRCKLYSCLPEITFQSNLIPEIKIIQTQDSFSYQQNKYPDKIMEWHLNFADRKFFGFYYTDLYAQDEIQCSEHPIISHLESFARKIGENYKPLTYEFPDKETPILVKNVFRLGYVDIMPSKEAPDGLYGNRFKHAPISLIKKKVKKLKNKTISNIIAIAAMGYGKGEYTEQQIQFTFQTAYKGFRAAVLNSDSKQTIIHTGNWGCGAFGNNYEFMVLTQLVAARLAQVHTLHYHSFSQIGTDGFNKGLKNYTEFFNSIQNIIEQNKINPDFVQNINFYKDQFIQFSLSKHYFWGNSDGN